MLTKENIDEVKIGIPDPEVINDSLISPYHDQGSSDIEPEKSTFTQILLHLFKSNIGIGLLNMPQNMSRGGLLFGPLAMVFLLFPIVHCMFLLLKCSREQKRRTGKKTIGYAGTFRYSLIEHFPSASKYAPYLINFFLITSQLGFCTAYISFTAETLQQVSNNYFGNIRIYMLLIALCICLPAMISRVHILAVFSGSANVLCIFSLVGVLVYIVMDLKDPSGYRLIGDPYQFPLFFATLMYVFEGINVIIPLDDEIQNPADYPLAINISTYGSAFLYMLIGLLGYIAYGDGSKSAVTLNLPQKPFTNVLKILYSLGVVLTFFIQFHVAMKAMIPTLLKNVSRPSHRVLLNCGTRFFFLMLTTLFAIAVPQLSDIISLNGSLACSSLCLIFPCIIHMGTYWNQHENSESISKVQIFKDVLIILMGILFCVAGLFTTIRKIYYENTQ